MVGLRAGSGRVRSVELIGLGAVAAYVALVGWATTQGSYHLWGGLVVVPVLVLLSVYLLALAARHDRDPTFLRLLAAAFVVKALATVARYWMAFVLYGGSTDAGTYDVEGARLAEFYSLGIFDVDIGKPLIGTGFIRVLTGGLYVFTGPSIFVAYAFYSWLSFWGLYFLYRAFRTAVPDGNYRRYAVLVLFLPSMVFWPSGLGKEAWMTFGIGLLAFGAARLLVGHRGWIIPLSAGLAATALARPHITAAMFAGLAVALLVRRRNRPATALTPLAWIGTFGLVVVASVVVVTQAAQFLNIQEISPTSVDAAIDATAERTNEADSTFDAVAVNSPIDLPAATVSVLFRPFLFEAHNIPALVAAVEGTLLLVLVALALPRLRDASKQLLRQPYLVMSMTYILLFVYAFSNFSNFGILTRERVQVLPFVLVFLALPRKDRAKAGKKSRPILEAAP
ncbi:MAG: hypothetical protein GEU96_00455 [Propionibacteriales bacterium]|nr:hypothetical protein [Propionibacteriales bacterium]